MEIDFDSHLDLHRMAILHPWLKAPGLDCLESLFVQSHAQRVHHSKVGGAAVGIDHNHQRANSLVFRFAGFLGELRIRREDWPRWSHSPTGAVNTAANTLIFTWAYATPVSRTDASSVALAYSAV